MTDATEHGNRSGGLWATPLAEQRRADEAAEAAARRRTEAAEEERAAARAAAAREPDGRDDAGAPPTPVVATDLPWRGFAAGTVAALFVAAVVSLLAWDGPASSRASLSSDWGTIPMRCDTTRIRADDGRVLELFDCRGTGATKPPSGNYGSPARRGEEEANWSSDVDRRPARASRIRTRDGVVLGWAFY